MKKAKVDYKISEVGEMPAYIHESSGLAPTTNASEFWTHNDSGNAPELYRINLKGEVLMTLSLPNLNLNDWEDLAYDPKGNLYIADIGNNYHQRQDLHIYKLRAQAPQQAQVISLRYADQKSFPSLTPNFDCEAVVWHRQQLYLFSKNWSKKDHTVKMYSLPDTAGTYTLWPKDSVEIKAMVTGAAISPDGKTLALMTYGKVVMFDISEGVNFKKPLRCIKTERGQTEAIMFVNNTDFIFTNEKKRKIYLAKWREK